MSTLSDFVGIDIGQLASAAVKYQTEKNKANSLGLDTTIDQLKNTISIYETTNRQLYDVATAKNSASGFNFDTQSLIKWGALAVGGFLIYKLIS